MILRRILRTFATLSILALLFLGQGLWNATRAPIMREGRIAVADWPKGAPPLRVLLLSDIHVAGPDMPPARLDRIVAQVNAVKPDLILIAGDLLSDKHLATRVYRTPEIVEPLRHLRAPLGTIVVLGNHDHWFDPKGFRRELEARGITLLQNSAVRRGPVVIGGIDDDHTHHANLPMTWASMDALKGPRVILTHSPDIIPKLLSPVAAVFAGHTHCGQITLPILGQLRPGSRLGMRFNCGLMTDNGQKLVVGAGLGTSIAWLRYGTPPDFWLVTLGPK
jgi:predicted MPP superfamily phosphohydrolase